MKVAIFGGTGFVGGYLIDELLEHGHTPIVLTRPGSEHKLRHARHCLRVTGAIHQLDAVRETLQGADAAIYNIGIIRAFPQQGITFEALHFAGAKRVMDLASETGANRLLLMSANRVRADGTAYQKTKYMAEQYLQTTDLDWTIFRPSVLFGDPHGQMEFATQLCRDIVRSPLPAPLFYDELLPLNTAGPELSPVHVGDVARVVVQSLERKDCVGRIYPLGGPETLSWKAILATIAEATGERKFSVPAPAWAVKAMASLFDGFAAFPISRDQIAMLMEGNTCDSHEVFEQFGIEPTPFNAETLGYLNAAAARSTV